MEIIFDKIQENSMRNIARQRGVRVSSPKSFPVGSDG